METHTYKFRREDFRELPVTLEHLTIYLNFLDGLVEATNTLEMTANTSISDLALDAKNLEILSVRWLADHSEPDHEGIDLDYEYRDAENALLVRLPHQCTAGRRIRIRTVTRCVPSDHTLEGIYKDATPPAAPQQYMSQCQQWGFQRIMPIIDDCRSKCSMTTTMEADIRYTHLISNGDIDRQLNPDAKPIPKPGDPSRQIITYRNDMPMAPYLFIAAAGTWDVMADSITYPSGRTVRLEYLVPPGRAEHARIPMEILKQAVLWTGQTQDYEYSWDTYRTICMTKSNFGGMENTGNTTIVTDAALIDEHTPDPTLLYAHGVIVHEFEHNQCGSETTMETPFDVWLNEAYTVDVERQFMADLFDPSFIRLTQVDGIRNPLLGPLAIEDSGHGGRIVREGFNDPDELIDGVTYVKAAEVIRMLRMLIGKDRFVEGKKLYFARYLNSNANTEQFFQCFEEVSGKPLDQFKQSWLYQAGYPQVSAYAAYDAHRRQFTVTFQQAAATGKGVFHLPVALALVDEDGNDIPGTQTVYELKEQEESLVISNVSRKPAFVSLNRDFSFYGTFKHHDESAETLRMQAMKDPNVFNRVEAMRRLTDQLRVSLLEDRTTRIDPGWLALYGDILADRTLPSSLKAYLIRIDEQPLDRRYIAWFPELVAAREALMKAVNTNHRGLMEELFFDLDTYKTPASPRDGIEDRILKAVLLDLMAVDDSGRTHAIIIDHYRKSRAVSDRLSALVALNRSSSPQREEVMQQAYQDWHHHVTGYANYLRAVGSGEGRDFFERIQAEKDRPTFDMHNPTWTRALFMSVASNNKMLWTDQGIGWVADMVVDLAPKNSYNAGRLLHAFQHVKRLRPELQIKVRAALADVLSAVPYETSPSVHGQARSYLA